MVTPGEFCELVQGHGVNHPEAVLHSVRGLLLFLGEGGDDAFNELGADDRVSEPLLDCGGQLGSRASRTLTPQLSGSCQGTLTADIEPL